MHVGTLLRLLVVPLLLLGGVDLGLRHWRPFWEALDGYSPISPTWADAELALAPTPTGIVVLGSSVGYTDLDGELLQRETGLASVHSTVGGADARTIAMRVPGALDLDPEVLVLALTPSTLGEVKDRDDPTYDPRAALGLDGPAVVATDLPDHLDGALRWASVLVRYRRAPREVLFENALDTWDIREMGVRFGKRLERKLTARRKRDAHRWRTSSTETEHALCWIGRYAVARGARPVLLVVPVHPRAAQSATDDVAAFLGELGAACGYDVPPAGALGTYTASDFTDAIHMSRAGRVRYSRAVGRWLAGR